MGTFSVNNGQITEAISYPLHIQSNFDDILLSFKDNVDKLIDPKDIRNGILSLWSSVPFKQTSTASITSTDNYIGIDATDPSDRDIKKKLFIGKRSYSGTYSYDGSHDIMTNTQLLDSDIDIFLFNTKPDTISNTITRMSILSGKNTGLYTVAPFIQSEYISGATESLSIDFVTKVGDVNFKMTDYYTSGTFSVNNIQIPTRIESATSSGLESKTFIWRGSTSSGRVFWEELTLPVLSTIGTSSETLTIYGNPTNVNGYSLELNSTDYTPRAFGGIPMGTTFNNVAISEVLRRIIYPYLGPLCTITTNNNYVELGTNPTVILDYTITKRTDVTQPASLTNMTPAIVAAITTEDHVTVSGSATGQIPNGQLNENPIYFSISVTDGTKTATASTFIQGIIPYFYGISSVSSFSNLTQITLTKLIEQHGDKELYLTGLTGQYVYFMYDASYPDLSQIIDGDDNDVLGFFTLTTSTLGSPQNYWANKPFKIYKRQIITPIGPPNVKYQFRY